MNRPLAHSPRPPVGGQLYHDHVQNVRRRAVENARCAAAFNGSDRDAFIDAVDAAATYHDLGKLDEANQQVLHRESRDPLPVFHEDAGVAALLRSARSESAILVAGHHSGLFSTRSEMKKPDNRAFRDLRMIKARETSVAHHVDQHLDQYVAEHHSAECPTPTEPDGSTQHYHGFARRVGLSCLVDADHADTARHYENEVRVSSPQRRWKERLEALDNYVADLPKGDTQRERNHNELRRKVYQACRNSPVDSSIRACDAPVGSGKTTAVMAHLLRAACERQLRHLIVVLPYTNIITQSVEVYRKALALPGERPADIVAEHHHRADFEDLSLRQLATLWGAPVTVTTAVQFFETLASHRPARLRKLHELPGSAVFVDETHAAIPSHLWPQVWRWFETWAQEWSGYLVLASGSLPRFWELEEFIDPPKKPCEVPDLLTSSLHQKLRTAEKSRVRARRRDSTFTCDELIDFVTGEADRTGPRLLILNTVQSAAVVADRMRRAAHDVLHISTALAPVHRERIVDRVQERLKYGFRDWTLVATSCVEAGMNFSFRSGFRETASTASLIQVGGRVNRGVEYNDSVVWDFRVRDPMLSQHPGFTVPRRVLNGLFDSGEVNDSDPSDLAKKAMRREVTAADEKRARELIAAEVEMEYPTVSNLFRVIEADTRTIVINRDLAEAIRKGERVDRRQLLRESVQMWVYRIEQLAVEPILPHRDEADQLYVWTDEYDPDFLGYMAGVLPFLEGLKDGIFVA